MVCVGSSYVLLCCPVCALCLRFGLGLGLGICSIAWLLLPDSEFSLSPRSWFGSSFWSLSWSCLLSSELLSCPAFSFGIVLSRNHSLALASFLITLTLTHNYNHNHDGN